MSASSGFGHQLADTDPAITRQAIPAATATTRFIVERAASGALRVRDAHAPRQRALQIDFNSAEMKRRIAAGRKQPLARACGLHKRPNLHIIDATAGLGRDGLCLAALGARVTLCERHPLLFALLEDALLRLPAELAARVELLQRDACSFTWPEADVIFLDPMFPSVGKRASPGLELQYLQQLVGPDDDAQQLWEHAMAGPARRVVLKRPPRGARVRLHKPDFSYGGGRAVYEVYVRPQSGAGPEIPPSP